MPDDTQQIRINALLLEREALFVRIHELERSVTKVFGEPFPFTRPLLPSEQKGKRKAGARAAGAAGTSAGAAIGAVVGIGAALNADGNASAGVGFAAGAGGAAAGFSPGLNPPVSFASKEKQLRKLEPETGEHAYRVTYRQLNQTVVETHDSTEALRTLLASQGAQLQVLKIETIDTAGTARATLFNAGV